MASREEMSRSFGAEADTYQRGRPEYPADPVAWLLEPVVASAAGAVRVADVGAGTGKLTRAVARAGATEVVAIDPDPAMLEALQNATPGVPTFVGTAEQLPLADASQDAVVFGQAWHWVDVVAASAEGGRVLRPGGVLGLIWNVRSRETAWVAELDRIMTPSAAEQLLDDGGPAVAAPFRVLERRDWPWTRTMTRADVFAMAGSRSYLITAEPAERAEIEARIGALLDGLGIVGDATIEMPYVTCAFRAIR